LSFLLAGTLGATQGWRDTFYLLGAIGVVIAVPLMLLDDRRRNGNEGQHEPQRGAPFIRQVRSVLAGVHATPVVLLTIIGFVLVHMVFAGLAFAQLWLVRERGFDAAGIAREIGVLQIVFGVLGSVVGGVLSDRLARHIKGGHAGFMVLLVLLCGPLMIAYRLVPAGSALFYVGMCAGFFLPLAMYGPANALIQGLTPPHMRSTVTGFTMLLINVFAIAIGSLAVGAVSDRLSASGSGNALTAVLLATDVLAIASVVFFALAARGPRLQSVPSGAVVH
jgi:predicted MFS family arabinose efflux permease